MSEAVTDWRGNEIKVDSHVVYPRASGRSVEMREAVVLEIVRHEKDRSVNWRRDPETGKYVWDDVPAYKFRLQPTGRSSRDFHNGEKPVWVQNGENVTLAK